MDGIYDILNYMTDDDLFTHQLPRAKEECTPHILAQYPQLEDVDTSMVNGENWEKWLNEQVKKFGEKLPLKPLISGFHKEKDPVEEAEEMMKGKGKVITVELKNETGNIDFSLN